MGSLRTKRIGLDEWICMHMSSSFRLHGCTCDEKYIMTIIKSNVELYVVGSGKGNFIVLLRKEIWVKTCFHVIFWNFSAMNPI